MYDTEEEIQKHLTLVTRMFTETAPPPMVFCDFDGENVAFGCPFTGDDSKEMFAHLIRSMVRERKITGFCFVAESWTTRLPDSHKNLMPIYMAMPPAERPYTTEIILATFSNAKTEVVYMADLTKDKDGNRKLGNWEKMPHTMEGRFSNLWQKGSGTNN